VSPDLGKAGACVWHQATRGDGRLRMSRRRTVTHVAATLGYACRGDAGYACRGDARLHVHDGYMRNMYANLVLRNLCGVREWWCVVWVRCGCVRTRLYLELRVEEGGRRVEV